MFVSWFKSVLVKVPIARGKQHNDNSYLAGQFGFGAGGILRRTIRRLGGHRQGRSRRSNQTQFHDGQCRVEPDPDWKGRGEYYPSIYGEYCQEAFWRRWLVDMLKEG